MAQWRWEHGRALFALHGAQVGAAEGRYGLVHFSHDEEVLFAQRRGIEAQVRGEVCREVRGDVGGRAEAVAIDICRADPVPAPKQVEERAEATSTCSCRALEARGSWC